MDLTKSLHKPLPSFMRFAAFIMLLLVVVGQTAQSFTPTLVDLGAQKGIVPVVNGGSGVATLTAHGVVLGEGTANVAVTSAGSAGAPLVSGGASADPSFTTLTVSGGGTGAVTFTAHAPLIGEGTGTVVAPSPGTSGQCYISNGASVDPSFQACPGGGAQVNFEVPSGTINGTTTAFSLANTPNPALSLHCYKDGILMAATNDFTLSVATVTFVSGVQPKTGDSLTCDYLH